MEPRPPAGKRSCASRNSVRCNPGRRALGREPRLARPVAFILAGDVAVAYFMAHAPRGFFPLLNGGELAIVYCFAFLYFWLAGGGEWSLDRLLASGPAIREMPYAEAPRVGEPWAVTRLPASAPGNAASAAAGRPLREKPITAAKDPPRSKNRRHRLSKENPPP